jgi:hypothetical protein
MSEKSLTLLELNGLVRELIEVELPNEYWVEAELSECRENRGHCYMELIQRDDRAATPVARASAKCWASKWSIIRPYFERTTGQQLRAGIKVLMKVYAQFHEAYGFSWIVTDIDPNDTLGDQARRRQEIIRARPWLSEAATAEVAAATEATAAIPSRHSRAEERLQAEPRLRATSPSRSGMTARVPTRTAFRALSR